MLKLRKPSLFAVMLTLFGVIVFVRLAIWQLQRAQQKEQLLHRFAQASSQPLLSFAVAAEHVDAAVYPHVRVRGRFDSKHIYVLDNQSRHDHPGVLVYAPFRPCSQSDDCSSMQNRSLLVALGFVRRQGEQHDMPALPPLKETVLELTGLYAPSPGIGLRLGGNALQNQTHWPKLTTYLDMNQLAIDLQRPLFPRVLLLDPDPASTYIRSWTPAVLPPVRHRAYAFQWFSFALAALIIFVLLHRQREPAADRNDDEHDTT